MLIKNNNQQGLLPHHRRVTSVVVDVVGIEERSIVWPFNLGIVLLNYTLNISQNGPVLCSCIVVGGVWIMLEE